MNTPARPTGPRFNEHELRQARALCDQVAHPELQRALQGIPVVRPEDFRHHKEKLSAILLEEHLRRLGEHVTSDAQTLRALAQKEARAIRQQFDEARSSAKLGDRLTEPPALTAGPDSSRSAVTPKMTCDRLALAALRQEIPSLEADHSGEMSFQMDRLSVWLLEAMQRRMQAGLPVDDNTLRVVTREEVRKRSPEIEGRLGGRAPSLSPPASPRSSQPEVFVVYGHDDSWKHLESLLYRIGAKPVVFSSIAKKGSETTIEILARTLPGADAVVVLMSADDEGRKRGTEDPLKPRARENVLIEAGCAVVNRRDRVILVALGGVNIPSDFDGIHRVQGESWTNEMESQVARRLYDIGLKVDVAKAIRA